MKPTQSRLARAKAPSSACLACTFVSSISSSSFIHKHGNKCYTVKVAVCDAPKQMISCVTAARFLTKHTCVFGSKSSYTPSLLLFTLSIAICTADIWRNAAWSTTYLPSLSRLNCANKPPICNACVKSNKII